MKLRILLFTVAGAVVGSTSLLGFRAARSTAAAEKTSAEVRARTAIASAKVAALETRRAPATPAPEKSHAPSDREPSVSPSAPMVSTPPTVSSSASPPPRPAEPMEDAKLQLLSIAAKQMDFAITHGPFFRTHRLTPDQIEKLTALLARHDARLEDVLAVARARGLRPNDPVVVALRNEAVAELRAPGVELLGESGYAALQEYERTVPVRAFVGKIAGLAALTGDPLTPAQAEDLARVLTTANSSYVQGGKAELGGIDWSQADAAAPSVLSPTQFELFSRADPPGGGPGRWTTVVNHETIRALQTFAQGARAQSP